MLVRREFDIIRGESSANLSWVACVEGLDQAKEMAQRLAVQKPGCYIIWDRSATQIVEKIESRTQTKNT